MLEWAQIVGGENKWRQVDGINAWYVAIQTRLVDHLSSIPFVARTPQPLDFPNALQKLISRNIMIILNIRSLE